MSKLRWYWHRLKAMSAAEMALHARKKLRQRSDAGRTTWPFVGLSVRGNFPVLPAANLAPASVQAALRFDLDDILAGHWKFFGHLELKVPNPPRWQYDYVVGQDVETTESAFRLNYRSLRDGVDSKIVWEPSRWFQIVRLAMAAYVLREVRAAETCLTWLEDWVKHNPAYRGWNWTSALEVGLRLIQFAWIDALLEGFLKAQSPDQAVAAQSSAESMTTRLRGLREAVLVPHVWYAWRHRSFGSSANNHLLGELAGVIVAVVRWPELAKVSASLDDLATEWRREVLAQFAPDGGNREQALNYQLFSWEFCWQARQALASSGQVDRQVDHRLKAAASFFWEMQARQDHWDYGDSDNGFVVPFFAAWNCCVSEWHLWMKSPERSESITYWVGPPPSSLAVGKAASAEWMEQGDWWNFPDSGQAIAESGFWWLRWDLSPLGFLKTAAHGHLDALHLSIWRKGVALVIDPGTGAYHADRRLRDWLASRAAHNGPCPEGVEWPERLGAFLWGEPHEIPRLQSVTEPTRFALASLKLPGVILWRSVRALREVDGWEVADAVESGGGTAGFSVRWQFAPGSRVHRHTERKFSVHRADVSLTIEVDEAWNSVELIEPIGPEEFRPADLQKRSSLDGVVSPSFRCVVLSPYLLLKAPAGDKPCVFTTTFLASAHS